MKSINHKSIAAKREVNMFQRIIDWWLEVKIERLGKQYAKAIKNGQLSKAKMIGADFTRTLNQRSPSQIDRMHKSMGVKHG